MSIPETKNKVEKFDLNDIIYYLGLVMLFIGLALSVSIGTALSVVGAILAGVALANSYVRVWMSKGF